MVHVRLISKEDLASHLSGAALLSHAMRSKYGADCIVRPVLITDDPSQDLSSEIQKIYNEIPVPKRLLIEIFSHGQGDHLVFPTKFRASNIASIVRSHRNEHTKFAVDTLACYGGGLIPAMEKEYGGDPALGQELDVFVQTKPNLINIGDRQRSTPYHLNLRKALYQGYTYGKAIRTADIETKKDKQTDAESYLYGKKIAASMPVFNINEGSLTLQA